MHDGVIGTFLKLNLHGSKVNHSILIEILSSCFDTCLCMDKRKSNEILVFQFKIVDSNILLTTKLSFSGHMRVLTLAMWSTFCCSAGGF